MNAIEHASALMALGRFGEAADLLRPLAGTSYEAAGLLGGIVQAHGRPAEAEALYRRAVALKPDDRLAIDALDALGKGLFFPWGKGLFWPTRQVFMAAAVGTMRPLDRPLELLEVGSYVGGSALTWGAAAARFFEHGARIFCIDIWHERREPVPGEVTFGFFSSGLMYRTFLANAATLPGSIKVEHAIGWSADILPTMPRAAFDLVYVDGSHYYRDAAVDLDNALPLVRDGGLLCGDDLELQLDESDDGHARLHRHDDFIVDPRTGRQYHVGVTLALWERFGRVANYDGFWILRKTAGKFEPLSLAGAIGLLPRHWPQATQDALREQFRDRLEIAGLAD